MAPHGASTQHQLRLTPFQRTRYSAFLPASTSSSVVSRSLNSDLRRSFCEGQRVFNKFASGPSPNLGPVPSSMKLEREGQVNDEATKDETRKRGLLPGGAGPMLVNYGLP